MKRSLIGFMLLATSLYAGAALANAGKSAVDTPSAHQSVKPTPHVKVKLVDINSASKAELKTLPGIDDALAEKIIKGRPYLSKAFLVTRNIITMAEYDAITRKIIAKQKPSYLTGGKK